MIEGSLSRRYAKALFELARENGREEAIERDFERFLAAYAGSPLQSVLTNPAFEAATRKRILEAVAVPLALSSVFKNFLSLLHDRDRWAYLPAIAAVYHRMLNEAKGRVEARVVSSSTPDEDLIERLKAVLARISGKEVLLRAEVDPGLIGGLVLEWQGKVYDGSVRTQLENMKQRIARAY
ncbi:MAG TPA: ATP synthase F1 subunit delta [Candidatus Eisenbacteria bacterium]|nr:ATP synthase F1 subunit delta [Candidatus Eisenbacteria bacterium]